MTLSEHQAIFLQQICLLILWANARPDYRVRAGQFHRSDEEQERLRAAGRSRVRRSRHQDRLAADLILDKRGPSGAWVYQRASEAYRELGEQWKAMDPEHNVWGGDWGWDGNHFERRR